MSCDIAFIGSAGGHELLIVFVVVLLVFGPKQLPRIAKLIGKALQELRSVSDDFRSEIMSIDVEPLDVETDPDDGGEPEDNSDDQSHDEEPDKTDQGPEVEDEDESNDLAG